MLCEHMLVILKGENMKKICEHCQKEFEAERKERRFCSLSCKSIFSYKNRECKKLICAQCKAEYQSSSRSKFCSEKCSDKYWGNKSYYNRIDKVRAYVRRPDVKARVNKLNKSPHRKAHRNKYLRQKRKTDPVWRLKTSIIDRLRHYKNYIFSYKTKDLESHFGYSFENLWKHLLTTIPNGYVEQDYLNGVLEMDHIIPCVYYISLEMGDAEFKKCWDMSNLRLITKDENISRNNRGSLDGSFYWKDIATYNIFNLLPESPKKIWENNCEKICKLCGIKTP